MPSSLQAHWKKYRLRFKRPARTSRNIMQQRDVWFLFLTLNGIRGIGECAPLAGLSIERIDDIEKQLDQLCANPHHAINHPEHLAPFPSLRFALEMALLDLQNGGIGEFFPLSQRHQVSINGLIWMGDADFMRSQITDKLAEGYQCIKIKIGGLSFDKELKILQSIRQHHGPDTLEIRLDANGAFTKENVASRLTQLAAFSPHSIEQPIAAGQWDLLATLCKSSPIPIALDEELIPLLSAKKRAELLDQVQPQFIVLKPSLLGGFKASEQWKALAEERSIGWWVTSALESNIGLDAISQWTAHLSPKGFQGLGTGQLFINNLPSPIGISRGLLTRQTTEIWRDIHQFMLDWLHPSDTIKLQTSGSTGSPRTINMKKSWMEASAQLTTKTLKLKPGSHALLCLPLQYIAGKMMLVRAICLNLHLTVTDPSSNPLANISGEIDFTAMTPMQLSNSILQNRLEKVKMVLVGGAPINPELTNRIQSQKTRIIETWGMTETASHIALRTLNGQDKSDYFSALPGIHLAQDEHHRLIIRADHLGGKPILSNDVVKLLSKQRFRWLGRYDNVINSGAIKLFPEVIEQKLRSHITERDFFISKIADPILGQKIVLYIEGEPFQLPEHIWDSLTKFEKPNDIQIITAFSRTGSGKLIRDKSIDTCLR
jgi:o-succinylbenzoate synthase